MTTKTRNDSFIDKNTRSFCQSFLEQLDTPVSLGVFLHLKYKDDIGACSCAIDPLDYEDATLFGKDYQAVSLLSKFRESNSFLEKERKALALDKFWSCENHLSESLPDLRRVLYSSQLKDEYLRSVLYRARDKIARILGPIKKTFKVEDCNFGPGASSSVPGRKAHPSNKFTATDVSAGCVPFYHWFFQCTWFAQGEVSLRESSRVTVVPKNFKSDRVIAIEPDWNIFFQKGFGAAIRRRLKQFGLDLDFGADRHDQLAKLGSLSGALSTLDLSSASDLVSTYLVRFLLPDDWFICLNSVRTDSVSVDGKSQSLLKFSSMGNGFTFELETLVFLSLALASQETTDKLNSVSVFGDDIIVPTESVGLLTEVLTLCGFKLNKQKSYSSGYFRESCGSHYFDGKDVKPLFIKKGLRNDSEVFKACNGLRRFAYRFYYRSIYDTPLDSVYSLCKRLIRRVYYIPEGYGDGGLISSFDEVSPSAKRRDKGIWKPNNGIEGFYVRSLLPIGITTDSESIGLYLFKLRTLESYKPDIFNPEKDRLFSGNQILLRASDNARLRVGRILVKEWCDPEVL